MGGRTHAKECRKRKNARKEYEGLVTAHATRMRVNRMLSEMFAAPVADVWFPPTATPPAGDAESASASAAG